MKEEGWYFVEPCQNYCLEQNLCFCRELRNYYFNCLCKEQQTLLSLKYIPVSDVDMCMSPPFLSSRRHSASACGIPRVMAVDGGLTGTQERVMLLRSRMVSYVSLSVA